MIQYVHNKELLKMILTANGDTISSLARKMKRSRSTVSKMINTGENMRLDDLEFIISEYNLNSNAFIKDYYCLCYESYEPKPITYYTNL